MKLIAKYCSCFVFSSMLLFGQIKEVNHQWKDIKKSDGKIKLTEIKTWGKEANDYLKNPLDVTVDSKGNLYISNTGEDEIRVFSNTGKVLRAIGRGGQGPGEFNHPNGVRIDSKDNLIVADEFNNRVQIFINGQTPLILRPKAELYSLKIDKNDRILLKSGLNNHAEPKLHIYDYKGNLVGKIGSVNNPKNLKGVNAIMNNSFSFAADKKGNYYIANLSGSPCIEKYGSDGKMIMKINMKLCVPPKEVVIKEGAEGGGNMVLCFEVDAEGNIYVLVQRRELTDDEVKNYMPASVMSMKKGTGEKKERIIAPKMRKGKYDLYMLVVFDTNGNLKGSKSIDYLVNNIEIAGDNIFILDSANDSVIHQYKIEK